MKKFFVMLLALVMVLGLVACTSSNNDAKKDDAQQGDAAKTEYKIAMITDYGDITDQSFNQTTYEACQAFAKDNDITFTYYKPAGNNTADRVAMIEKAADEGYNVMVMPGYAFAGAIVEAAPKFKDVKFIALDVGVGDLLEAGVTAKGESYDYNPDNWKLEDYGGMAVPAVIRYGYGFVQGADAAAKELGIEVEMNYAYGGQFNGDADITAAMDTWYQGGTEVVFACGGGIYTSAAEAAQKVNAKVIGVDVDQKGIIDGLYGEGMTVTSAMKGLYPATYDTLKDVVLNGNWENYAGKIATLGLVSGEDPTANYVQIPFESTQWSDKFTQDDYKALVAKMFDGTIKVDNGIGAMPAVTNVKVNDQGNLK